MAADVTGQINPQRVLRASKVIDHAVYNQRGEELGEVDDLIMSRNGKIKKVILSVGEFLQTGEKLVAVPFESLQINDRGQIVYNATKEQLKNLPRFSYRREQLYGEPFFPLPAYGIRRGYPYMIQPPPRGSYPHSPPEGKCCGEFRPWEWEYFSERLRVSALLNRGILDSTGQEVADLDDLMISPEGRVKRIILDVGGFLGIGVKLVAVPFRPLKITDLGIVYSITTEQLRKSPAFRYEKR